MPCGAVMIYARGLVVGPLVLFLAVRLSVGVCVRRLFGFVVLTGCALRG